MGGPHFSEDFFKGLVKRLVLFHRVPQAEFEGSLSDLKSSTLDENKEFTKTRGACSFIYDYSILKNKEFQTVLGMLELDLNARFWFFACLVCLWDCLFQFHKLILKTEQKWRAITRLISYTRQAFWNNTSRCLMEQLIVKKYPSLTTSTL